LQTCGKAQSPWFRKLAIDFEISPGSELSYSHCHLARNLKLSENLTLSGGRNNLLAVARLPAFNQTVVIKGFPAEREERFYRETLFLTACEASDLHSVPRLLESCADHQVVVMTHERGNRPTEFSINQEQQIVEFLVAIQDVALESDPFPDAIEAVWSTEDFKSSLQRRTTLLQSRVTLLGDQSPATKWLELVRLYTESALYITDLKWLESMLRTTSRLPEASRRFLSPSDLGMHNCLNDGGRLIFLDFEYAGTDSGINLVGDLVMQPDSVWSSGNPFHLGEQILNVLFGPHSIEPEIVQRLFGVRWSLIMLLREPHSRNPASPSGLGLETQSYISSLTEVLGHRL
jgi:hypothetical protein